MSMYFGRKPYSALVTRSDKGVFVETKSVDAPLRRYLRDPAAEVEAEKRHVRKLAENLGGRYRKAKSK